MGEVQPYWIVEVQVSRYEKVSVKRFQGLVEDQAAVMRSPPYVRFATCSLPQRMTLQCMLSQYTRRGTHQTFDIEAGHKIALYCRMPVALIQSRYSDPKRSGQTTRGLDRSESGFFQTNWKRLEMCFTACRSKHLSPSRFTSI